MTIPLLLALLLQDPAAASVDELAEIALRRANEAFNKGEFRSAEDGYRGILRDWPKSSSWGRAKFNLGVSLHKQAKFPEARAEFQELIASNVNDGERGDHVMELRINYRPKALALIGECYEAEGNWEKALEVYLELAKRPANTGCGTCNESARLQSETRVIRALNKSGRVDEALKKCRDIVLPDRLGIPTPEVSMTAVDIAVARGTVDEFEKELEGIKSGPARMALDYLRVLRWRAAGDHVRLFDVLRAVGGIDLRSSGSLKESRPVAAEAAECLGELGDAAFEWVRNRVRADGEDKSLALYALANFKTPKALEIIRGLPERPQSNDALVKRNLETIHAAKSRVRSYPPAKR